VLVASSLANEADLLAVILSRRATGPASCLSTLTGSRVVLYHGTCQMLGVAIPRRDSYAFVLPIVAIGLCLPMNLHPLAPLCRVGSACRLTNEDERLTRTVGRRRRGARPSIRVGKVKKWDSTSPSACIRPPPFFGDDFLTTMEGTLSTDCAAHTGMTQRRSGNGHQEDACVEATYQDIQWLLDMSSTESEVYAGTAILLKLCTPSS
jgi:hypothetical protein